MDRAVPIYALLIDVPDSSVSYVAGWEFCKILHGYFSFPLSFFLFFFFHIVFPAFDSDTR